MVRVCPLRRRRDRATVILLATTTARAREKTKRKLLSFLKRTRHRRSRPAAAAAAAAVSPLVSITCVFFQAKSPVVRRPNVLRFLRASKNHPSGDTHTHVVNTISRDDGFTHACTSCFNCIFEKIFWSHKRPTIIDALVDNEKIS